jgi:hypothetical protein
MTTPVAGHAQASASEPDTPDPKADALLPASPLGTIGNHLAPFPLAWLRASAHDTQASCRAK